MQNQSKKSSSSSVLPLIIIAVVLGAAIAGAYYLYSNSQASVNSNKNSATASNSGRTPQTATNAPPGATPPNMLGSPTAAVTVEEFADFQCPSCATSHPVMKEVQQVYGSRIKFIFRHFPLSMHDKAYEAAVAAEAAGEQGKFWAMQDQLFSNQQTWANSPNYRQLWVEYAQKIGLDVDKFQTAMAGIATKNRVDQDAARARGMGVSSTPTVYVNGRSIPYPELKVASLRQIIDAELQQAAASSSQARSGNSNSAANAK